MQIFNEIAMREGYRRMFSSTPPRFAVDGHSFGQRIHRHFKGNRLDPSIELYDSWETSSITSGRTRVSGLRQEIIVYERMLSIILITFQICFAIL